jgi:hypothetical protein
VTVPLPPQSSCRPAQQYSVATFCPSLKPAKTVLDATHVWPVSISHRRGSRPRALRDRRYDWAYLFGAACPERHIAAGLVMPTANAETMSLHLKAISRKVAHGSQQTFQSVAVPAPAHGPRYHARAAPPMPQVR